MKKWAILLMFGCHLGFCQDAKDAAAEKSTLAEGRLRDAKPCAEKTLADGTQIAIWTLPAKNESGAFQQLAKATASLQTKSASEDLRTAKSSYRYENGKLATVNFSETIITQSPMPSVSSKAKDLAFADGVQVSPPIGTAPEIEKTVSETEAEIQKLYQEYVNQK